MLKRFNSISKKDLLKYNWFHANITLPNWKTVQWWKIYIYKLKKANFWDKLKRKLGIKTKSKNIIHSEEELLKSPYLEVAFVSNDMDIDWGWKKLPPYLYSYILYSVKEPLEANNNDSFLNLDIYK